MRIKNLCFLSLLTALLLTSSLAMAGTTHFAIKGKDVVAFVDGKEVLVPKQGYDGPHMVKGADIRIIAVSEDMDKTISAVLGFYFFDPAGKQVGMLPHEMADAYLDASLSPGRKTLALNLGGALLSPVVFYTWPELKPLAKSEEDYVYLLTPTDEGALFLLWVSDTAALFNTMNNDTKRPCGYDPCGISSVTLYNVSTDKRTPVQAGTDLCDYSLVGYSNGTVTVRKSCKPTVKAWESFDDQRSETLTVPLPK